MSILKSIAREARFLLHRRSAVALLLSAAVLSSFAVWSGLAEIGVQRADIEQLLAADVTDRQSAINGQSDYGGAAYYSFHLTYDPPSDLAFAALGERDLYPWKHRIRMLALEGQIYESDPGNPALAFAGVFDFAFVASILAPLFVILFLYDLIASERAAGRHDLLLATHRDGRLWLTRAFVRICLLAACLLAPFWAGAMISGAGLGPSFGASLIVFAHLAFWAVVSLGAAHMKTTGSVIAAGLAGLWLAATFIAPQLGERLIERSIPAPEGGDIVLTQREAVNDAWDLPKEATMTPFIARHPEWADKAQVNDGFEWKWYYAFQQVGDQSVETLSEARREAMKARDRASWRMSLLSPPALVQRSLARIAGTDAKAALSYEMRVRRFHHDLRMFYYPLLFEDAAFDREILARLPDFGAYAIDPEPVR